MQINTLIRKLKPYITASRAEHKPTIYLEYSSGEWTANKGKNWIAGFSGEHMPAGVGATAEEAISQLDAVLEERGYYKKAQL